MCLLGWMPCRERRGHHLLSTSHAPQYLLSFRGPEHHTLEANGIQTGKGGANAICGVLPWEWLVGKEKTGREALVPAWGWESTWKASAHFGNLKVGDIITLFCQKGDDLSDGNVLLPVLNLSCQRWRNQNADWLRSWAKAHKNFAHDPVVLCFYVYNCLVRFLCRRRGESTEARSRELPRTYNLKQHIASSKAVALPFLPRRDSSLCHGRGHCGHLELGNGTGRHCATHQIRVILISAVVITSLFYPALAIYSSSQPRFLAHFSSQILDPFLAADAISSYDAQHHLCDIWAAHDSLHVREDSVVRARCGVEQTLRVERVLIHSSASTDSSPLTRQLLHATLHIERKISDALAARQVPCLRRPDGQCLVVSPLMFWHHDERELATDVNVLHTLRLLTMFPTLVSQSNPKWLSHGAIATNTQVLMQDLQFSWRLHISFLKGIALGRRVTPPGARYSKMSLKTAQT
jgi:hypothetical protein